MLRVPESEKLSKQERISRSSRDQVKAMREMERPIKETSAGRPPCRKVVSLGASEIK